MTKCMRLNMLPTGCYIYKVGTHAPATRSRWVTPALRLSDAKGAHTGAATVLRTRDDLVFSHNDDWDNCEPADNIHCAYSNSGFMGCQTIKGGMFDVLWADFARVLKTMPNAGRLPSGDSRGGSHRGRAAAACGATVDGYSAQGARPPANGLGRRAVERLKPSSACRSPDTSAPAQRKHSSSCRSRAGFRSTASIRQQSMPGSVWGIFAPAPTPTISQPVAVSSAPQPMPQPEEASQTTPPAALVAAASSAPVAQTSTAGGPSAATIAALGALAGQQPSSAAPTGVAPASTQAATAPSPQPTHARPTNPSPAAPQAVPAPIPVATATPSLTPEPQPQPLPSASAAPQAAPAPNQQPAAAISTPPAPTPPTPVAPATPPKPSQATQVAAASPPTSEQHLLLTADDLREFAPRARPEYAQVLGSQGNDVLTRFGINRNDLRFCHFMAQVAHECGEFTIVEENLNYSAKRMVEIFGAGRHSAAIGGAEAQRLVGSKEAFAERVYGLGNPSKARDLGNTKPGDGYRYRGRGFLQITGRAAYREMGKRIGVDLEAEPDKAGEPLYALMTAAAFWDSRKLNTYADQDNIEIITKRINGGFNGLADRKRKYAKAVEVFSEDHKGSPSRSVATTRGAPDLRRQIEYGDLGSDVLQMKQLLSAVGYGGFAIDEDFSRATHVAVVRFQLDRSLPANGIVEATTWEALEAVASFHPHATYAIPGGPRPAEPSGNPASPKGSLWLSVLGLIMLIASISVIVFKNRRARQTAPTAVGQRLDRDGFHVADDFGLVDCVGLGSIRGAILQCRAKYFGPPGCRR